jgi:hypothetical protein
MAEVLAEPGTELLVAGVASAVADAIADIEPAEATGLAATDGAEAGLLHGSNL